MSSESSDGFRAVYTSSLEALGGGDPIPEVLAAVHVAQSSGTNRVRALELLGNDKVRFTKRLDDAHVVALVEGILAGDVVFEALFLCFNHITDDGAKALAKLFVDTDRYKCTLKTLDLRGCAIGPVGCAAITKAMIDSKNDTLQTLVLNGNPIGTAGGMAVAQLVQGSAALRHLDVGNCELETAALVAFATVLTENSTLTHLNLDNPRQFSRMEDTAYHLARMLANNTGLLHVSLAKHGMGDFGAKLMAEYLSLNTTLTHLCLRANKIASVGGQELASLVVRGSPLEEIDLQANRLGDEGAKAWSVALARATSLRVLNVRNNSIGDEGLTALATAFEEPLSLLTFRLWGNDFGRASTDAFAAQHEHFGVKGIQVDFKPYVVDDVVQLAEVDIDDH